jgi:hypothetical protein
VTEAKDSHKRRRLDEHGSSDADAGKLDASHGRVLSTWTFCLVLVAHSALLASDFNAGPAGLPVEVHALGC